MPHKPVLQMVMGITYGSNLSMPHKPVLQMVMGTYGSNLKIKAQIHIKYSSGHKLALTLSEEGEMRMPVMVSMLFHKGSNDGSTEVAR
jgi:hypothetical protein